ncbi:MAG: outer membrane beta-barrel protein [Pirellulales bacterium]
MYGHLCPQFDLAWSLDHDDLLRAKEPAPPEPPQDNDSLWRGWFIPILLILAFALPLRLMGQQGSNSRTSRNPLRTVSAPTVKQVQQTSAPAEPLPAASTKQAVPMPAEEPLPTELATPSEEEEAPLGTMPLTESFLPQRARLRPQRRQSMLMGPNILESEPPPQGFEGEEDYYPMTLMPRRRLGSRIPSPGAHTDRNDPHRHLGIGDPLQGTSWLNRPLSIGLFAGGIFNSNLINGHVLQNNTSLVGARLGWDFDHYWGTEIRYAFANPNITDTSHVSLGDSNNYLVDLSLMYYPLGDTRWRPFAQFGLGQARFSFKDDLGNSVDNSLFGMPIGVGLKYYASPTFAGRVEFMDNIAFGTGNLATQNNFSLSMGFEYRFGGKRPMYYPWHGGMSN